MRKVARLLLGLITIIPLTDFLILPIFILGMFQPGLLTRLGDSSGPDLAARADQLIAIQIYMAVVSGALFLFYLFHLLRVRPVSESNVVLWAILLFILIPVSPVVYWYLYVFREKSLGSQHTTATGGVAGR